MTYHLEAWQFALDWCLKLVALVGAILVVFAVRGPARGKRPFNRRRYAVVGGVALVLSVGLLLALQDLLAPIASHPGGAARTLALPDRNEFAAKPRRDAAQLAFRRGLLPAWVELTAAGDRHEVNMRMRYAVALDGDRGSIGTHRGGQPWPEAADGVEDRGELVRYEVVDRRGAPLRNEPEMTRRGSRPSGTSPRSRRR